MQEVYSFGLKTSLVCFTSSVVPPQGVLLLLKTGYLTAHKLPDTEYYNVPQERKRVIFIEFLMNLEKKFSFNLLRIAFLSACR